MTTSEYNAAYYARNRDKALAYARQYRADHADELREKRQQKRQQAREYHLQRAYGLGLEEYDTILDAQGGGCAVCGMTPEEFGKPLFVDHDHDSGEVRGLLCDNCNRGIGHLQDSIAILQSAVQYLNEATD